MNRRLFLIVAALAIAAQPRYSWRSNPPPQGEFSLALARVWAAAAQADPFQSIRGEADAQAGNWHTLSLPGSSGCRLYRVARAMHDWEYRCSLTGPKAELAPAYRNVQRLVHDWRDDWKVRPSHNVYGNTTWFFYEGVNSPVVYLNLTTDTLTLAVYPPPKPRQANGSE